MMLSKHLHSTTCEHCLNDIDILPETKAAHGEGHEEGHQTVFKVIGDIFRNKKISRLSLEELNKEDAIDLLRIINYVVNY